MDLIDSRPNFRGWLVPLPGVSVDPVVSTLTQAGPRPGGVVSAGDSELTLLTSGIQTAGDVDVRVGRAGIPTGRDSGLGLLHRPAGAADWRGWDAPASIRSWEAAFNVSPTTPDQPRYPAVAALADGTVVMVYGAENTGATKDRVQCVTRDPLTGSWSAAVQVYDYGRLMGGGNEAHPALVVLPSGRILCYYWVPDIVASLWLVYMSYSDDQGATWTLGSRDCAPMTLVKNAASPGASGISHVDRITAVYHTSGIGLLLSVQLADTSISDIRDRVVQGASTGGAVFDLVYSSADPTVSSPLWDMTGISAGLPTMLSVSGSVVVVAAWPALHDPGGAGILAPESITLGSVWQRIVDGSAVDASFSRTTDCGTITLTTATYDTDSGGLTACVDETGVIYAYMRQSQADGDISVIRSEDLGATWEHVGQSTIGAAGTVIEVDSSQLTYPYRLSCCWQRGRVVLAHQSVGQYVPSVGNTIGLMYLGGWTTVTLPRTTSASSYDTAGQITLSAGWIPITLPDASPAVTVSGAGTAVLTGTYETITTAVNELYYTTVPAGTIDQGVPVRVECATLTGGVSSDAVVVQLRAGDGTNSYVVTARIGTSAIRFRDDVAGALISSVTIDTTGGVDLLMQIQGSSLAAYVRQRSTGEDCDLGTIVTTNALVDGGASAGNQLLWGHRISTAQSRWWHVSWDRTTATGLNLATMSYPLDLQARHIDARQAHLTGGLTIGAYGGPGLEAQQFTATQTYDYPITAVDTPSPRIGWRGVTPSAGLPVQEQLVYPLRTGLTTETALATPLMGVVLLGANIRTGSLDGQDAAGVWSTITTWDAASDMTTMEYVLGGQGIVPAAATTDHPYLAHGECAGWIVEMVPAGGGASVFRRLSGNAGGVWGDATQVRPVLYMESPDGTEPTTGTLSLYPPDFAVLAHVGLTKYRALRLVLDSQGTPDGYIAAGTVELGALHIVGADWSYGRVVTVDANVTLTTQRDGTDRAVVNGPPARTLEVSMVDGIDMRRALGTAPTPDVYSTSSIPGSKPVGTLQSWPMDLMHLIAALDGAATPMAYFDDLQKVDVQIVNRRDRLAYVRVTSPIRLENRVGLPGIDELVNIATVTMHEVV